MKLFATHVFAMMGAGFACDMSAVLLFVSGVPFAVPLAVCCGIGSAMVVLTFAWYAVLGAHVTRELSLPLHLILAAFIGLLGSVVSCVLLSAAFAGATL